MKKIFFIIIFIYYLNPVYSQWIQQTSGTTSSLTSVNFINENTGFCVGSGSTIIKTTNGGNSWILITSPVQVNFDYVKMFTVNNVIIGSLGSNLIIRTTDGGISFEILNVNIPSYESKLKIQFVSFLNGYFLTGSYIYKTSNSGSNWVTLNTSILNRDISFIDQNTGYLCGKYTFPYPPPNGTNYSEIRQTTDGGSSWDILVSIQEMSFSINRVFFINSNTGFYNGFFSSSMARTINGGISWGAGAYGAGNFKNYYKVSFPNNNTGWFIGDQIIRSTNSGLNWNVMTTSFGTNFKDVFFIDTLTGWMVSNGGLIIKTTTGGITGILPISSEIPGHYSLSQNYPNPFNPTTKIKFQIPASGSVAQTFLYVYDILGREIATLVNQQLKPGTYEVEWDASVYPSGVYFYKLSTGDYFETKRMVLLK
jgi:photosystem II stability/assembly factor-like uncharacterized protein